MQLDKILGRCIQYSYQWACLTDFEIAIECGANIVRVGTALFGEQTVVPRETTRKSINNFQFLISSPQITNCICRYERL